MSANFYIFIGKLESSGKDATHSIPEDKLNDFIRLDQDKRIGVNLNNKIVSAYKKDFIIQEIKWVPGQINIWLDDERDHPSGWLRAHTSAECIALLQKHKGCVYNLSLDHDLGDDNLFGTGYDVAVWLEEKAFNNELDVLPKNIIVHSQNNVAAERMRQSVNSITNKKTIWHK